MLPYHLVGEGEPILFLHGLGNTKSLWDSQLELSDNYQLIIPDLRGHGENPNKEDINLPNLADDVIKLMDALSLSSVHVCGLSMGGLVAFELFKQAPERIRSIVLTNTTAYCIPWLIDSKVYEDIHHSDNQKVKQDIIDRCLYKRDEEVLEKTSRSFNIHKEAFIEASKQCSLANYLYLLPFIKVPVLIISGVHDRVTPPLLAYQMKMGMPHARFHSLNNGHLSNIENSTSFNKIIDEFIADQIDKRKRTRYFL
ncbi:alpha/beta fold hydrolase [Bacillus songklensis]|uniref:Alpha/beta fold hydrolase n=1 Tax=Bacillus songklensis TaxID=1069116 RepID=A0ABV8B651_9BACI